jgi:SSS family solute:Na+ symporter
VSAPLLFLVAYAVLIVGFGLWIGRAVRTSREFFVAGRNLSAGLLFSSFLAANIGAGTTVGATSLAYREGLSAWWWNGSAGLGSLVLAFWVGPRIWREAKAHGYLTVGDFLERRYGRGVAGLVAAVIWLGTLSILAGQLLGAAAVLSVAGGVPRTAGFVIAAAVTTAYFTAGGLRGSAWVNSIQLAVIVLGFLVALPPVISHVGGWAALATGSASRLDIWYSSGAGSGWTWLILLAPSFIVSPGLLQKAYGARDERALRLGVGANGIAQLLFAFLPVTLGMAAHVALPDLSNPNDALPSILTHAMPPALGAIGLAAVFSAEVSSADAVLFMLATSASRDLYRGFVNRTATEAQMLRVARWAAIVGGALGVALAMAHGTVEAALAGFYSILTVTLFVPILGGLLVAGARSAEAYAAIIGGVAALFAVQAATDGRGFGLWTPTLVALVVAAAGFVTVHASKRGR